MELKGRLGAIALKIPACGTLADIGTDHAYIPIYASLKGLCARALATDVKVGPVKIAERNIRRYNLDGRVEARLGYGLEPVAPGEADVTVVAGMGGPLICEILQGSLEKARRMKLLVLQPMNVIEAVRQWLNEAGFAIHEEILALEGKKLYNIICTSWTGSVDPRDEYELYIGKELLRSGDPLLKEYLVRKIRQLDVMIEGRSRAGDDTDELGRIVGIRNRLSEELARLPVSSSIGWS